MENSLKFQVYPVYYSRNSHASFNAFKLIRGILRFGESGKPKIGLALGAGAARGIAHLGVIDVLRAHDIPIHCISGTSMGAVVGGMMASESLAELWETLRNTSIRSIISNMDPALIPAHGILKGKKAFDMLEGWFGNARIEDTTIPFGCIATDINTGERIVMRNGSIAAAIRASMSIPVIFYPWKFEGSWYIDGGLVDPVPVELCREMGADAVIAVDVLKDLTVTGRDLDLPTHIPGVFREIEVKMKGMFKRNKSAIPGNILELALNAVQMAQKNLTVERFKQSKPDIIISPCLEGYTGSEFNLAEEIAEKGRIATRSQMDKIKKLAGN